MHSRFDQFRATALGMQLESLIDTAERYLEYAALSRAQVPAVAAIVHDLRARFPEVQDDQTARQFCGSMVADVMRRHRHDVLRPRGRVPGGYFTYGAVWSALPVQRGYDELLEALATMPRELRQQVDAIPEALRHQRPPGTGFCVLEHACHLRDLDIEAFRVRIDKVLDGDAPVLPSVDGSAWAQQRDYMRQDLDAALTDFTTARANLVARLRGLDAEQRRRYGLFDGRRRMTVDDLVESIHEHDRTHLQELDELKGELAVGSAR